MKIYVITGDKLNMGGGGITHLMETFEAIAETGNDVQLFAPQINFPTALPVHQVFTPCKGLFGVIFFNLFLFLTLCRCLVGERPDCIYTRQLSYSFIPSLLAKLFRVKNCQEVNGILYDELRLIGASAVKIALIRAISRVNFALTDRISVTVKETKKRLIELYETSEGKIEVISCAAANHRKFRPSDRQKARREVGLAEQDFVVGFVGTLYAWHGIDLFLAAVPKIAAAVKNFRALLVGDGVELPRLIARAQELDVQQYVTFTGLIPYQQVPTYIQAFDVGLSFFKPVRPIPGIPMKMYEYMACGIPVIASGVAGYGSVVSEEGAGLSIDSGNPAEIVEAVCTLARDHDLRDTMGRKGRQAVEDRFNWEAVSIKVEDFIKRTLC